MMPMPASMVWSRPLWWEAVLRRLARTWLRKHNPRTLAIAKLLSDDTSPEDSPLIDKLFPPADE